MRRHWLELFCSHNLHIPVFIIVLPSCFLFLISPQIPGAVLAPVILGQIFDLIVILALGVDLFL